jgi:hypothetical protein
VREAEGEPHLVFGCRREVVRAAVLESRRSWRPHGREGGTHAIRLECVDAVARGAGVVEPIASGLDVGLAALPGMPPPFLRSGVTVDAAGAMYVIGDVTNVVYRITRR